MSAFSTWEKELHKIVFDPRYLLLTSKERKQVFEKYVKERAEEERREKRNKMKERKEQFQKLLEEAGLHGKYVCGFTMLWFLIMQCKFRVENYSKTFRVFSLYFVDRHLAILLRNMEGMSDLKM